MAKAHWKTSAVLYGLLAVLQGALLPHLANDLVFFFFALVIYIASLLAMSYTWSKGVKHHTP